MKISLFVKLSFIVLICCIVHPGNVIAQKDKKKKKTDATTGWNYNEPESNEWETVKLKAIKLPKPAKKYFDGMVLIEGGTFAMGRIYSLEPGESDSTLLVNHVARRVTVSSFYISDHEVTNGEYREFVDWVIDSVCLTLLAKSDSTYYFDASLKTLNWDRRNEIYLEQNLKTLEPLYNKIEERFYSNNEFNDKNVVYSQIFDGDTISIYIYPDTLCWVADNPYSYNEPMSRMYFWHPAYANYPVVGVSYIQAEAYCSWRTKMMNDAICKEYKTDYNTALAMEDNILMPNFRLPTEAEWEYAALSSISKTYKKYITEYRAQNIFPWLSENLTDKKGNYLANFGSIIDQNSFQIKTYSEYSYNEKEQSTGGYYLTSPVKSFPPNGYGLYDMAGNVAEWVLDSFFASSNYDRFETQSYYEPIIIGDSISENFYNDSANYEHSRRNYLRSDNINYLDGDMVSEVLYDETSTVIKGDDDVHIAMKKLTIRGNIYNDAVDIDTIRDKDYWLHMAELEIHNARVHEANPNAKIAKGGSWATGPAYMQCGSREAISEFKSKSRLGFRVGMTYLP